MSRVHAGRGGCGPGRWFAGLRWLVFQGVIGLVLATACFGADDNKIIFPGGATKAEPPAARGADAANTYTLVIAVIIAAVGAWMFWRNRKSPGVAHGTQHLAIEETKSLGNRQYLVVAAYQDKKYLLGVCQGRIDLLAPLHDSPEKEHEA